MKNISYDQAIEILRNYNTILIDVQTESDYVKKHMINSINIPVEEINQKVNTIIKDKNQIVIVYCLKGIRSIAAYDMLKRLGYNNVYNIQGGIDSKRWSV